MKLFAVLQTQSVRTRLTLAQRRAGCAGVHPCQQWICHAGHRWGGILTSESYTNCSKELWKSSDRGGMRRMMHLRKEIDGATISCSTGFPVSFLIFWEEKVHKKQPLCSLQGIDFDKFKKDNKGLTLGYQFSSVAQSCLTLCDPMNRSTPGLPVHHQLQELTLTQFHQVNDAIQPSHPLSSPSPPAPNPSKHQGLFQRVNSSHEVAKVLEFQPQHQSFQWIFRTDLL